MRITNRMVTGTYLTNLNKSMSSLADISNKVTCGRSYLKASENPSTAIKALQVRQNLSRISLYQNNVSEASDMLTDAETAVSEISSILTSALESITQGTSDSYSADDRDAIAVVLRNYQSEIFDISNTKVSDKYIFGGTDRSSMPFQIVGDTLEFQGVDVDSNASFPEETLYYDIGLGLKTDASGQVEEGTAMNVALSGSEIFGTGVDDNGVSENLYNLLGQIAQMFEDDNVADLGNCVEKLESRHEDVILQYVNIGQKQSFTEFLTERYTTYETNALEKQTKLEGIDEAEGAMNYQNQKYAYQAALSMGSEILQMSLLDYL